jgi:hypothetical protein
MFSSLRHHGVCKLSVSRLGAAGEYLDLLVGEERGPNKFCVQ